MDALRETLTRVFREHLMMTMVAWASVAVAAGLSVGVTLFGASLRATLIDDLEVAYHNVLVVRPARGSGHCYLSERECGRGPDLDPIATLTPLREVYGAEHVAAAVAKQARLSARGAAYGSVRVVAIDLAWLALQPVTWVAGRPFYEGEMRHDATVAIVGRKVFDSLTALLPIPPREIEVDGRRFAIIGVVDAGATAMISLAGSVVIPRQAAMAWGHGLADDRMVLVGLPGVASTDVEHGNVIAILRAFSRLRPADPLRLDVSGLKEQIGAVDGLWSRLRLALLQLSGLLALAASVSIGALQYTVTSARKHELGVRRSFGARRADLTWDGVIEAAVVAGVGTAAGAVLAVTSAWGVAQMHGLILADIPGAILIGAAPCILLGAGAGGIATAVFARKQPADLLARPG